MDVRELLAYAPFAFEGLVDESRDYEPMFAELFDERGFAAPFGLTTAERRHPCFNYSWAHGDTWNQESWPYETSRLLKGLADRLHAGRGTASLTAASYAALLTAYAEQHVNTTAANDTGVPHVYENVHPFLGYWNNRERMYWTDDPNRNMGDHYLHSTYGDLVLAGLLGIRAGDGVAPTLRVAPLVTDAVASFAADNVLIRGREIAVVWDATGTVYSACCPAGLSVFVDGVLAAHGNGTDPLEIALS